MRSDKITKIERLANEMMAAKNLDHKHRTAALLAGEIGDVLGARNARDSPHYLRCYHLLFAATCVLQEGRPLGESNVLPGVPRRWRQAAAEKLKIALDRELIPRSRLLQAVRSLVGALTHRFRTRN